MGLKGNFFLAENAAEVGFTDEIWAEMGVFGS